MGLVAGQFCFYDNNENSFQNGNALGAGKINGGDNNEDAYLLYQQAVATCKPSNKLTLTGALGYMFYADHGGTNSPNAINPAAGPAAATGAGNGQGQAGNVLQNTAAFNASNATRDLSLASFNGDVKIDLGKFKVKLYGQAVYNFTDGARDRLEYAPLAAGVAGTALPTTAAAFNYVASLDSTTDKLAFATGVTLGSDYTIKKKGDYVLLAEYRQVGLGSVDPNLNDSDFNFSRLGFRGIKGAAGYVVTPYIIASVAYYATCNLGSEKNLNLAVGNYNTTQTVQFDLVFKF